MTVDFVSLAVICLISAAVPVLARMIPRRIVPEAVILLVLGAIFGPYLLGVIQVSGTVSFLKELGLGFLFLLAGFEIDPKQLGGRTGAHSFGTWLASFLLAGLVVAAAGLFAENTIQAIAVAIALTSTALGTLMPILAERGLMGTRMGELVITYGTWGELGPVIAMALLLSSRSTWASFLVLVAMGAICVLVGVFAKRAQRADGVAHRFIVESSEGNSQSFVRLAVVLLVVLIACASIFQLDIVLGSFAAGFVLRYLVPEENTTLEPKLVAIGHGFFIPLFFVVSGANIDLTAIMAKPLLLLVFIVALVLVRFVPLRIDLNLNKDTKDMNKKNKMAVAFYCTTALPIIVAVTSTAVSAGAMDSSVASVLVAAGAITVLVMPLLGLVLRVDEEDGGEDQKTDALEAPDAPDAPNASATPDVPNAPEASNELGAQ